MPALVTGFAAALLAVCGLAGLLLRLLPFDRHPWMAAAAFASYLLPAPLLGALIALLAWHPHLLLCCVAVSLPATVVLGARYHRAPDFVGWPAYLQANRQNSEPPSTLTVLTANLRLGRADPSALIRLVTRLQVDVLVVCELTPLAQGALIDAGLGAELPYQHLRPRDAAAGVGIWSRHPLGDLDEHKAFTFPVLSAELDLTEIGWRGPGPLIVALHLPGPWPRSPKLWHYNINRLRDVLRGLIADLERHGNADTPVFVAGDFNATLDTAQFRALLSLGFVDAGAQCGAGLARTYPAGRRWLPPLIGVDHLLVRGARTFSFRVVELPGSDHRAIVGNVALDATR